MGYNDRFASGLYGMRSTAVFVRFNLIIPQVVPHWNTLLHHASDSQRIDPCFAARNVMTNDERRGRIS
jgi:hypothetical protein